ncbi:glycosyltransferase [Photobacterium damselae subsp. damselae]|uniref:glycosyltransferase n=1 Tax=Photobacterium damselae TaxID=38293 RepID=UPI0015F6A486|nr:glycosyltransferase [Photobacterium damselae]MBA5685261.1 glycosyltransferase [Photobacterium damselae subsp. damselae]
MKFSKKRYDIITVIPQLGGGGGERVACTLSNAFVKRGLSAAILVYKKNSNKMYESYVDPNVDIIYLDFNHRISRRPISFIKKLIRKINELNPKRALFCSGTINCFVSLFLNFFNKNITLIARETNLPSLYTNRFLLMLYKLTYKNFDKIIAQSDEMYNEMFNLTKAKEKIELINNPIDTEKVLELSVNEEVLEFSKNKVNIVTSGRLTYQKGFDMLINSLAKVKVDYLLHILGDGEEKVMLVNLVNSLNMKDKVIFHGSVTNPFPFYKKAHCFISSSRWEGYPNVVIEALACGTPVISNSYPGGIKSIINSDNGVILDINKSKDLEHAILSIKKFKEDKVKSTVLHLDYIKISKKIIPDVG